MEFEIEKYNIYKLKEGSKYSICPLCSHKRKKNTQKCALLDWITGIGTCQHCGEKFQLHTYAKKKDNFTINHANIARPHRPKLIQVSTIPENLMDSTLKGYSSNNFYKIAADVFGDTKARELMLKYKVGTSKHWEGANIFWQVDKNGAVRTGKIMLYDPATKKRIKEPNNKISWVHKVLNIQKFNPSQCLFGEHLTKSYKPIAIVESEKTAIIASGYLPNFTWIATGGMQNLTAERLRNLEGKTITVFPDLDGISEWKQKAEKIAEKIAIKFVFNTYLEENATDEDFVNKLDLADYLLRFPYVEEISDQERILRYFQQKNPALKSFIEKFDLVIYE